MSKSHFPIERILSIILGIFFSVSAYGKLFDAVGFAELIASYGFDYLSFLSPVFIALEVAVGISLILDFKTKYFALVSAGLLTLFTLAFAYGYFVNGIEDCGCFGSIDELKTNPVISFIRNFILIGLALFIWKKNDDVVVTKFKIGIVTIVTLAGTFLSFHSYLAEPASVKEIKNSKITNSGLQHPILKNYIDTHPDSTYMVILIGYGCPHCHNNAPNVAGYLEEGVVDRVVALGYQPEGTNYKAEWYNNIDWPYETWDVDIHIARAVIAESLPTTYIIKNNRIEITLDGIIYPVEMFKSYYPDF